VELGVQSRDIPSDRRTGKFSILPRQRNVTTRTVRKTYST
jgi:hypothetical protein